jgi:hypothetical protein
MQTKLKIQTQVAASQPEERQSCMEARWLADYSKNFSCMIL